MNRRKFIKISTASTVVNALATSHVLTDDSVHAYQQQATPSEIEGPFYPANQQADKDFDLTQIEGHENSALGKPILIEGHVLDLVGSSIEGATIELWQANAAGKYWHPRDPNPALIDENFQGWAIVKSGEQGRFRFKTIMPGVYPVANGWSRPPHIHFKVFKQGYQELTTQMYFPDEPLNKVDRLLQRKNISQQQAMTATYLNNDSNAYYYKIVLQDMRHITENN